MKYFCVDRSLKQSTVDQSARQSPVDSKKKQITLELKVCEGCGGLWLRARHHGVYCRRCAVRLSDFPAPRHRSRAGRKPKQRLVVCEGLAQ